MKYLCAVAVLVLALAAGACGGADLSVIAIRDATLFNGTPNPPVSPANVVIRRGRILAAGDAATVKIPDGAEITDGTGLFVFPLDPSSTILPGGDANLLLLSVNPGTDPNYMKHVNGQMKIGRWTVRPTR
jgi:hypothetical protein